MGGLLVEQMDYCVGRWMGEWVGGQMDYWVGG